MNGWYRAGVASIGLLLAAAPVWGQVVRERDTKATGPRGRSIERDLRSVQGPGFIERQTTIHRPGGTFQRDVMIERPPVHVGGGGGWVGRGPGFYPGRPPVLVERDVIVQRPSPLGPIFAGLGGFGLGFGTGALVGAATSAPPVVPVYPAPVYAAPVLPPPTVVYNPPQPYSPAPPPPPTVVVDPVASAIARLQSHHAPSRRDGAEILGRLRDPRAIPALVDRLKNDTDKHVRIAAATAMGQIGDPNAAIYLERSSIYDKKQEVRDAAAVALSRLPQPAASNGIPAARPSTGTIASAPTAASVPTIPAIENVPPPPTPESPDRR